MHYLLIYELCSDYLERRAQFRDAHLALAWHAAECGDIVLAGALDAPADRAMLLFDTDSAEIVEKFARNDPYVVNGLVERWEVRKWNTVVGESAATPVR
ncbi:YciI-like protein [Caballeronia sp. BR00000012568055]|uniref:YciI-like protein n=1 Tax=Caballeronia sp. BR00000012568055 TaxID=2918761 RepID=UPI0023F7285F